MPLVSITRLQLKSIVFLLPFLRANEASVRQLIQTPGLLAGKELVDKGFVFWTLTLWDDDACMKNFRNSKAHKQAMQKLPVWCNEASYNHWAQDALTLPDWAVASAKLLSEGKITKVRHPSERHLQNHFPPIQWHKLERILKAAKRQ